MRQAVILAGGQGTRLRSVLGDRPKALIPIGGRPLIEHLLELCRRHGVTDVLLLLGYQAGMVADHVGDGRRWGLRIRSIVEDEPRGTAGAVLAAWPELAERFLVLYGDEMANLDLTRLWDAHAHAGAQATLVLHPNDHPLDSDLVEVDEAGGITAFHHRPHPAGVWFPNLVNAALYLVERDALEPWRNQEGLLDFGNHVFPAMLARGQRLLGYRSFEYLKDIGTPDRYERVGREYAAGVVAASTLERPQRAVFIDRDGTLNREVDGVCTPERLELLPGAGEAVRALNAHGWRAVVITNQPGVAKGFFSEADLQRIHNKLECDLGKAHAFVDRIYHCPHHPERGFPGERAELKVPCRCRKPEPGLIERAARELHLDLRHCWFVGDTTTDLETARRAGVRSILVRTGYGGADRKYAVPADHVCDDLPAAVRFVLDQAGAPLNHGPDPGPAAAQ